MVNWEKYARKYLVDEFEDIDWERINRNIINAALHDIKLDYVLYMRPDSGFIVHLFVIG